MIDLSNYGAVESAFFFKWAVPGQPVEYLSDYNTPIVIDGHTYTSIGTLLGISQATSELKAARSQLTITLSGVPTNSVYDILTNEIKGSRVEIFRGFFNPTTHQLLDLSPNTNPVSKFKGVVTNFGVSDDVDNLAGFATTSITLQCSSIVEILEKKVSGRRTNSVDFEGDNSMDRVRALSKSNFNFGAPQ